MRTPKEHHHQVLVSFFCLSFKNFNPFSPLTASFPAITIQNDYKSQNLLQFLIVKNNKKLNISDEYNSVKKQVGIITHVFKH